MAKQAYKYAIIGGGLAGASAVEGIRERDKNGTILLIGTEQHLPYHRPPLTKGLWLGKKKVEDVFVHDRKFYDDNGVTLALGAMAAAIDANARTVTDAAGTEYSFEKLLIATGGIPRRLDLPGADHQGICYFRYLDDYLRLRPEAIDGASAIVIGGGFIGSEIAASLCVNKVSVTMAFPSPHICDRVFPAELAQAMQQRYEERGITIYANDKPASFTRAGGKFIVATEKGKRVAADIAIVGIGILPELALAQGAGLQVDNGIVVNELLETNAPGIFAAGDNALFPYRALGKQMRVEHWDNALNQGRWAGRNMAGAREPFTYMPYFFSDLFEFGYEAVGDVNSQLETVPDWQKENDTGVIYYLADGKVRGMMMCNEWDRVPAAREIILRGEKMTTEALHGALR